MELEQIKQQLAAIQKMCSDVMSQIEKIPATNQQVQQQHPDINQYPLQLSTNPLKNLN